MGFSGAIREELRPRGIRVTVVLPAATDTALWDSIPGEWNRANMLQPEDVGRAIAQLAEQPAYLTTEELRRSGHVAGRMVDVVMAKETTYVAALADIPPGRMRYADIDGLPIALANVSVGRSTPLATHTAMRAGRSRPAC